jgi:ABC-type ATPase involved in cell division
VIESQVPAILDLVGLGHKSDSFPTELSGGQPSAHSSCR